MTIQLRPRQQKALTDLRQAYASGARACARIHQSCNVGCMGQRIELTGQRFGRLVVERFAYSKNAAHWHCKCDCGGESIVRTALLRNGTVASCGCGSIEAAINNCNKGRKENKYIPLELRRPLKDCYQNMIKRCTDPRSDRWYCYGARGIKVCDEWLGIEGRHNFYRWALAAGYQKGMQLDRINVDGNYSPSNCRIVTPLMQMNNTTRNHMITWRGMTMSIADWAREFNLSYSAMKHRIDRQWPMDRIATQKQRAW